MDRAHRQRLRCILSRTDYSQIHEPDAEHDVEDEQVFAVVKHIKPNEDYQLGQPVKVATDEARDDRVGRSE